MDADVRRALDLAGLKEGEIFLDIGSGEGVACMFAARERGVYAIGLEINERIKRAWNSAKN